MRQRCFNPAASNYSWYGGRGISVHPDWEDYLLFRDWALSNGYAGDLELDRIDNDSDYEPSNCQWISKSDNVRKARLRPR